MATSETALLERRNAVGDVDRTAQLKWLRLRELLHKRSTVITSRESSPSPATGQASRSAAEERPGVVVDSAALRPSTLGRLRRAVPGLGRSPRGGDAASVATTLRGGGPLSLFNRQASFESYVTAPSDDDDDDCSPTSPRRPDARSPGAASANRPDVFLLASNELPLLDLRLPAAAVPNSSSPDSAGDFDFDPFDYELDTGESEDDVDTQKVTVPVTICLVIIGGYIFAGSVLFTLWEDWDYLTGSYFCFITLSTIGFGDIVPGTDMDKWASSEKLVLCALWLAFGLSLLAMCFNLMQEEVKEKCKWIGKKMGILKDTEDAG